MTQPVDFEYYFKCLLAMNQRGVYLKTADGHYWIEYDNECEYNWNEKFVENGIYLNNKIYGGWFEAIDTFDAAIQRMGFEPLATWFRGNYGRRGEGDGRISKTEKGKGGIM